MRNFIFSIILLLPLIGVHAQFSTVAGFEETNNKLNVKGNVALLGQSAGATDARFEIGGGRSADGNAYFDLVSDQSKYSDFGVRLIRFKTGVSRFDHRGNMPLEFKTADPGGSFKFVRQGNALSMAINSQGQVSVGTDDPGSFMLAVNGNIGSREVQVTATSPFPDYVFSDTYDLRSIEEVERYIEKHNHLPNIPSADQVENAGGFELGNLSMRLLEKIEELTLYIINQEKRIKALESLGEK